TGLYLSTGLKCINVRRLWFALALVLRGRGNGKKDKGEISPFQALMVTLSATVGTGNIAGVATAIYWGGPGAILWMWVIALVGMGITTAEAILAVLFRETKADGSYVA